MDSIDVVVVVEFLFVLLTTDFSPEKMPAATLVGDFFTGTTGFLVSIGGGVPFDFSSKFSKLFRKSVVLLSNDLRAGLSIETDAETVAWPLAADVGPVVMSSTCFSSDLR